MPEDPDFQKLARDAHDRMQIIAAAGGSDREKVEAFEMAFHTRLNSFRATLLRGEEDDDRVAADAAAAADDESARELVRDAKALAASRSRAEAMIAVSEAFLTELAHLDTSAQKLKRIQRYARARRDTD
jgi:hypothetical protein